MNQRGKTETYVVKRLEEIGRRILEDIIEERPPKFKIKVRSLSNTIWCPEEKILKLGSRYAVREFFNLRETRKFMQTVLMLSLIVRARKEGDYPTIRDLYYMGKHTIEYKDLYGRTRRENTWESQDESDYIIQDIEVLTNILREDMGIMFDAKGRMVGKVIIRSKGNTIDLSKMGVGAFAIPPNVGDIEIVDVDADYILIVEKGAIFERLNNEEFWRRHNCILMTGKGQPDRGTRRMAKRISEEFDLPVYVLTDSDPFGFYIYSVYKYGSISLSYESERLAVTRAKFLGVSTSDIYRYKIPRKFIIKATDRDIRRAKELLRYPWFKSKRWKKELSLFIKKREKVEIEAFSGFGFKYLSNKYIPDKIEKGEFID